MGNSKPPKQHAGRTFLFRPKNQWGIFGASTKHYHIGVLARFRERGLRIADQNVCSRGAFKISWHFGQVLNRTFRPQNTTKKDQIINMREGERRLERWRDRKRQRERESKREQERKYKQRERDRERQRETERDRERQRETERDND